MKRHPFTLQRCRWCNFRPLKFVTCTFATPLICVWRIRIIQRWSAHSQRSGSHNWCRIYAPTTTLRFRLHTALTIERTIWGKRRRYVLRSRIHRFVSGYRGINVTFASGFHIQCSCGSSGGSEQVSSSLDSHQEESNRSKQRLSELQRTLKVRMLQRQGNTQRIDVVCSACPRWREWESSIEWSTRQIDRVSGEDDSGNGHDSSDTSIRRVRN